MNSIHFNEWITKKSFCHDKFGGIISTLCGKKGNMKHDRRWYNRSCFTEYTCSIHEKRSVDTFSSCHEIKIHSFIICSNIYVDLHVIHLVHFVSMVKLECRIYNQMSSNITRWFSNFGVLSLKNKQSKWTFSIVVSTHSSFALSLCILQMTFYGFFSGNWLH